MRWLTIIFLFVSFQFSFAQNYVPFPDVAIWRVDVQSCVYCLEDIANCYCSRYQYEIEGDTISGIYTYKKLRKTGENISGFNFPINEYAGAFRQDIPNKKVYYLIPNTTTDTLLYDFDLEIGDTLPITYTGYANIIVISVDSILIGGQFHKRFELSNSPFCTHWVEGVGGVAGLLEPMEQFETDYSLICFIKNGISYYQFQAVPPQEEQCDIITHIAEPEPEIIKISPNPTPGLFTITITTANTTICIYDVLGNCVYAKQSSGASPQIDLSSQGKGVYFVEVKAEGERAVKKIVVQ